MAYTAVKDNLRAAFTANPVVCAAFGRAQIIRQGKIADQLRKSPFGSFYRDRLMLPERLELPEIQERANHGLFRDLNIKTSPKNYAWQFLFDNPRDFITTMTGLHQRFGHINIVELGCGRQHTLFQVLDICDHLGIPATGYGIDIRQYEFSPTEEERQISMEQILGEPDDPTFGISKEVAGYSLDGDPIVDLFNAFKTAGKITFIQASAEDLPEDLTDSAHFVFSVQSFKYFTDQIRALEEAHRIIHPGGFAMLNLDSTVFGFGRKARWPQSFVSLWANGLGHRFSVSSIKPQNLSDGFGTCTLRMEKQEGDPPFFSGLSFEDGYYNYSYLGGLPDELSAIIPKEEKYLGLLRKKPQHLK